MSESGPSKTQLANLDVAILIPCHDEEIAISSVVASFREQLPNATIYVYDNNSNDDTAKVAAAAGAIVRSEAQQGKGHVVRRMFSDIEASIYVLVDGDDTYDAGSAQEMIQSLLTNRCDMVNGRRVSNVSQSYRFGHRFGNQMLSNMVNWIFGKRCADMLSGYRVFSRRFVKSFPALSKGFEVETELTVHALSLNIPMTEVDTGYKNRPQQSVSKLNTYRDGFRILWTITLLTKEERPFFFYSLLSAGLAALSFGFGVPVVVEFIETGEVLRFPTAVLAASIMVLASLCLTTGLILDSVARGRREAKRLHYLGLTWIGRGRREYDRGSKNSDCE